MNPSNQNNVSVSIDPALSRWLAVAGWMYVFSGLALAALSFAPALLQRVNQLAIPGSGLPDQTVRVYASIAGGLTTGFGAILIGIARVTTPLGAVRAVLFGGLTWFVVDSAGSMANGSWQNVIGNTGFLLVALPATFLALQKRQTAKSLVPVA